MTYWVCFNKTNKNLWNKIFALKNYNSIKKTALRLLTWFTGATNLSLRTTSLLIWTIDKSDSLCCTLSSSCRRFLIIIYNHGIRGTCINIQGSEDHSTPVIWADVIWIKNSQFYFILISLKYLKLLSFGLEI